MQNFAVLEALTICYATISSAIELTPENWDVETAGKLVFVLFYADYHTFSLQLKDEVWDALTMAYRDSATKLVGEINCGGAGEALCGAVGINKLPSIKWGNPTALNTYGGETDVIKLTEFVEEQLQPFCSPVNLDYCDDDQKSEILKYEAMTDDELVEAMVEKFEEREKAQEVYTEFLADLNKRFEEASAEKEKAVAEIEGVDLALLLAVKATKQLKRETIQTDEL